MGKQPLYSMVYESIKREISEGYLKPGALLPTEQELEDRFQVSRTTVRKAISQLRDEGYLRVRQGYGTTVLDVTTIQKLSQISSITETLRSEGHTVTVRSMSITLVNTPEHLQCYFPADTPLYCLERILCSDGAPIDYSTTYLRAEMVPDFDQYVNRFTGLYSFLESKYGIKLTMAMETLSAAVANFAESQILNVPCGAPLLISKRLTNVGDTLFEYGVNRLIGERYKYVIYMQGR